MNRSGCITAIAALFSVVVFASGCKLAENGFTPGDLLPAESGKGTLVITLLANVRSARTIEPPVSMDIASFDIQGTGPDPVYDFFSDPANATGTLTLSRINPGLWTIAVDANNPSGTIIGHGQTNPPVLITTGLTTNAQIDVLPLSGVGVLNLTVQWPKGAYKSVTAQSSLTSMSTGVDLAPAFEFKPPGNPEIGTYSNPAIEAGYYLLTLQLFDAGVKFWGIAESVRIVAGQTTAETWILN